MKSFSVGIIALAFSSTVLAVVGPYGQCGGSGWTGETQCQSGWCCIVSNPWYSQCIAYSAGCPGAGTSTTIQTTSAATTIRTSTTTTRASATTTSANAAATTFCGQWDGLETTNGYGIYNNLWGRDAATSGSQCTWYNGIIGTGVSWGTSWTWEGGPYNVKSYATAGKLVTPKIVSTISSMPSTFVWTNTGTNMIANVAYDLFTSANSAAETWAGDYELMIWVGIYGGAGPISSTGSAIATVTVAGYSWKLYYGLNGTMKVYSFVSANGNLNNFSGDVKAFYTYLTNSQSFPASSQYLLAFQAGTEPFTGSGTLSVSQYSAVVN